MAAGSVPGPPVKWGLISERLPVTVVSMAADEVREGEGEGEGHGYGLCIT